MTALTDLIRRERVEFIALLESLDEEQWHSRSLCSGWTVENVAAHLAWAPPAGILETLPAAVRAGFRTNRMISDLAVRWTARGRAAILDQLRTNVATDAKPLAMPRIAALTDAVVHGLDVRVPLGLPHRAPDAEVFGLIADWTLSAHWPITRAIGGSARHRLRGMRLVATDTDWSWGEGAPVEGRADELLLLLTGRRPVPTPLHDGLR